MIPHPTTVTAAQESDRRQLFVWIDRDRRATAALGNGNRRSRMRSRRMLSANVAAMREQFLLALAPFFRAAALRRQGNPSTVKLQGQESG